MLNHRQHITPSPGVGVVAELGAVAERRLEAIALWDGSIQDLWNALSWYQERVRMQCALIASGNREPRVAAALLRLMDRVDEILEAIGRLEAQARAQVRGMEPFIAWAKQASRFDARLADEYRLAAADMTLGDLAAARKVAL